MQRNDTGYRRLNSEPPAAVLPAAKRLQLVRQQAKKGVVELLLPEEFVQQVSSGDYGDMLESFLTPGDFIYTYGFRYPGVIESVLSNSFCIGPVLELTHANPPLAIAFTLAVAAASVENSYKTYKAKEKARAELKKHYQASYQRISALLPRAGDDAKHSVAAEPASGMSLTDFVQRMNQQLGGMKLVIDESATNPAERLKIRCYFAAPPERESLSQKAWRYGNRVWDAISAPLGLAGFSYWVLWIGAALFTGALTFGVAGLPFWGLAFAIPAVLVLPYVALKAYHWVKNGGSEVSDDYARLKKAAEQAMPEKLFRALKEVEYQRQLEMLQNEIATLSGNSAILESKQSVLIPDTRVTYPKTTVAATFVTNMVDGYSGMQYRFWIVTDFLVKAALLAALAIPLGPAIGAPIFAGYLLWSGYQANKKRQEVNAANAHVQTQQTVTVEDLSEILARRLQTLKTLTLRLNEQAPKVQGAIELYNRSQGGSLAALSLPLKMINQKIEKPLALKKPTTYDFFNRNMSGIFFARLFFTGAAIFIPLAVVTLPFPPLTLALIALSGIVYAGFRLFLDYQNNKKTYADQMVASIERADKQIQLAESAEQVLNLRQAQVIDLNGKSKPKPTDDLGGSRELTASPSGGLFASKQTPSPVSQSSSSDAEVVSSGPSRTPSPDIELPARVATIN